MKRVNDVRTTGINRDCPSLPLYPALLPLGPQGEPRGAEPRFLVEAVEALICSRTRPGPPTPSGGPPALGLSKKGGGRCGAKTSRRPGRGFLCLWWQPAQLALPGPRYTFCEGGPQRWLAGTVSAIHTMETVRKQVSPKRTSGAPGLPRPTTTPPTQDPLARKGSPRKILLDPSLPLCL